MKKSIILIISLLIVSLLTANSLNEIKFNGMTVEEMIQIHEKAKIVERDSREQVIMEVLYEDWDWENDVWVNDQLLTYSYDADSGFYNDLLMQLWQEDSWVNMMHYIIVNNEFGWPLETLYQMWNQDNEVWTDFAIVTTSYNDLGQPTYSLMQTDYFGTGMMNTRQMTYTWNGDLLMDILTEEWDMESNSWVNDDWEIYTYDGEDQIEELEKMWEGEGTGWIDNHRTIMTYDDNHHMLEQLLQGWDLQVWSNQRHSAYSYDDDWNEIQDFEQEWDNDQWVNFHDKYYTYENDLMIERLTYEWNVERNWVTHDRQTMTYGDVNESEEVILPQIQLANYPNPFNPITNISFSLSQNSEITKLQIFNLKGQLVKTLLDKSLPAGNHSYQWSGKNNNSQDVSSGFYFYRLISEDSIQTKKMLLMK